MSPELAARWLGYLHQKGWLAKDLLPGYNARFIYRLSAQAQAVVQEIKGKDDTWAKAAWFGLGALMVVALTAAVKKSGQKRKPKKSNKKMPVASPSNSEGS